MILATKELIIWIALASLIGTIAVEEDVGTTSLYLEGQNLTTSSPTTPTTTTFTSTILSTSSEAITTSASTPTAPPLARANPISSSSTIRSIISTTTSGTGTTTKPSAKRQISLNEFQQLVAKVNDEISMLRNQSANLSQTYDELVRRYNERTSQIPIVLYDVTECTNATTVQEDSSTQPTSTESTSVSSTKLLPEVTNATVTTERATTTTETTSTTSSTNAPSSTKAVEQTTVKLTHSEAQSERNSPLDAVPQSSGSSHTQIYGNKYYNYIHYFMYPPSELQLEEINNPSHVNHRRQGGNGTRKVAPVKQRKEVPYQRRNQWKDPKDSREDSQERELDVEQPSAAFRRRTQSSTGQNRNNLRAGPIDSKVSPFGGSIPAFGNSPYRLGDSLPRKPIELPSSTALPKIPLYPYVEERTPPRIPAPQEGTFAFLPESQRQQPPETSSKAPAYVDKISAFLERRSIYRNDAGQSTTVAPARQVTPSSTVAREPVTAQSFESLFSFGVKPVNYSIPTTVKPLAGFVRNGWDGYDFSFVHKALETKKRLQREQRSTRKEMRDL